MRSRTRHLLVFGLTASVALAAFFALRTPPARSVGPQYVSNSACVSCHAEQHRAWEGSHHDLAMDHATPSTVLGNFEDVAFVHRGITSRFYRRDGKYLVETDGPEGTLAEFEVKFVFGVTPLQQYLIELEGGRLQCLQISWDTEKKRWFHAQAEPALHDDPLHWTGPQFNWNFMCAECHSTNLERNYDPVTNSFATTWSDIDVGCQACHGPGSDHVAWARTSADGGGKVDSAGLTVRLKAAKPQLDHCARCHARRIIVSEAYRHGDDFLDHYAPRLLTEGLYHADGQILDEVYVYGSFLQAKKHHKGVRCTDCHDAHTARLKRPGDATCTHCHQPEPQEPFPTLQRKRYDTPEHHFHAQGTPGSACVDCHMPSRVYMGNDARRDHSFRVPRPDLTSKIGTPNACNGCHEDKSAEWATRKIIEHLPDHAARIARLHFGEVFAKARRGPASVLPDLAALLRDPEAPAIVRATAARHLADSRRPEAVEPLVVASRSGEPLIRATAASGLGELIAPGAPAGLRRRKAELLAPLLADDIRWVRTEAARALADIEASELPSAHRAAYEPALREWLARQHAQAERPESHLTLGAFHEARGSFPDAEAAYARAVALDPAFAPVRFNLATLYNRLGRNTEALQQLDAVLKRDEKNGEAWYSLGLLHAELGRHEKAADALDRAARLLPDRPRVARNRALALLRAGRLDDAHAAFAVADRLDPGNGELLLAWAQLSLTRGDAAHVLALAGRLRGLGPSGARAAEALLASLRARSR